MSGICGILALQNTENRLLNAEFVDFSLFAELFMAHYAHFKFRAFLWLITLTLNLGLFMASYAHFLRGSAFCVWSWLFAGRLL